MSTGFVQFSKPEDFARASDQGFNYAFDKAASFEARAAHFNAQAMRTRSRDREVLIALRTQVGRELALYHAMFRSTLKHFLPETVDGIANPHRLDQQDEAHMQSSFALAVTWDYGRAHLIKALDEIGLMALVTPELLTSIGRKETVIDGERISDEAAHSHAQIQASRIILLTERIRRLDHYEPDQDIVTLIRNEGLRRIVLGEDASADDFLQMAATIPLNSPAKGLEIEWT